MILKIQRYGYNQDWWILDNIKKISIGSTISLNFDDYLSLEENPDILIMDWYNHKSKQDDFICFKRLSIRDRDDIETEIIFDTVAYLCNDDGKTIEKIAVNI